jgi:hypothetical protein
VSVLQVEYVIVDSQMCVSTVGCVRGDCKVLLTAKGGGGKSNACAGRCAAGGGRGRADPCLLLPGNSLVTVTVTVMMVIVRVCACSTLRQPAGSWQQAADSRQ